METNSSVPILFPIQPELFWNQIRSIIREEISNLQNKNVSSNKADFETPGMTYKPLYKISEICKMFQVTRPTIYDWIKHGKLKPYKIQSRVYFLWDDIQKLLNPFDEKRV